MSKLIDIRDMTRTEVTNRKEKDLIRVENEFNLDRIRKEIADSEESLRVESENRPSTYDEFVDAVHRGSIFGSTGDIRGEAIKLRHERLPLMETALRAGLRNGRDFRERWEYQKGWWWDELQPLSPYERTLVLDQMKRIVIGDKALREEDGSV